MNKLQKPLYTIDPHIYCSGTILINDIPVIDWYGEETESGGYLGGIDINHLLLQSGKHKIIGKMLPRKGKKTLTEEEAMLIDFYCGDADPRIWKSSKYRFHPKIESPWNGLSENINYPYFEIATEIEIELPFVLDGWQNSIDLSKLDKTILKQKVIEYYRQIHAVLKEHNASKFLELSKEKQKLQEQAFYFSEERKQSFKQGLVALFNQNLELEPLNENELKLDFFGYGKLVRLIKFDGTQPLQFKSPNLIEQSNIELEIKLHVRNPEKGFSII
mgnify:CR=1 FL=1